MKQMNEDKPWSTADDAELCGKLRLGASILDIARLLMRRPDEVEARIAELTRQDTQDISVFPRDIAAS